MAVVDKYATKHGNEALAKAYLDFLYSPAGQEIALKHHLRPIDPALLEREKARFERPLLVTAEEAVGGWTRPLPSTSTTGPCSTRSPPNEVLMRDPDFTRIEDYLARPYADLFVQGPHLASFPDRRNAGIICDLLLNQLFPGFFADRQAVADLPRDLKGFHGELIKHIRRSLRYLARAVGGNLEEVYPRAKELTDAAIEELPSILDLLQSDIEAAYANDPAALDRGIIILGYPAIETLTIQRFAHQLYRLNVPLLPRMLTEIAHSRTGIDIHPGARIGESFFIDHGTGVVIGETCTIGRRCVIYQGVTLGAWNPTAKGEDGILHRGSDNKRHPDLEDQVTVYAGATILGGDTVIGHHSVIGGEVWLTKSVDPYSVVMLEEPRLTIRRRRETSAVSV